METVDPFAMPKLMTKDQLEYWILFSICVAGKSAAQTEKKVNDLLAEMNTFSARNSPFQRVNTALGRGKLGRLLRCFKMGKYKLLNKAFRAAAQLDVTQLSIPILEAVPGIGPKSARMILLYSDPNANCVPLDTHILKWLALQGIAKVPKSTPAAGKNYERLEKAFQELAEQMGKTVRELDTEVWNFYAKRKPNENVDNSHTESR